MTAVSWAVLHDCLSWAFFDNRFLMTDVSGAAFDDSISLAVFDDSFDLGSLDSL